MLKQKVLLVVTKMLLDTQKGTAGKICILVISFSLKENKSLTICYRYQRIDGVNYDGTECH